MVRLGLNPAETPLSSVVNWMEHKQGTDEMLYRGLAGVLMGGDN